MNLKKWMSKIDDSTPLFEMNIVGTHDCVTRYVQFSHISKCQDLGIIDQLRIGVRALDIRVQSKDNRLKMVHGFAKAFNSPCHFCAQMDMSDVLSHCYRFLENNPSETIIFQFKNDSGKEMEKCFDNLMNTYIKGNESKWFLENRCPMLKESRGKIVLIRRCSMTKRDEYTQYNTGIDFSKWQEQDELVTSALPLKTGGSGDMEFIIQDRYKYKPVQRWEMVIEPFLNSMCKFDKKYIINYLSTAGGLKGPYRNSRYINPKFMEYPLDNNKYYGTIYVDFPTEKLVEKVIKTNISFFMEKENEA